jgi:hypothetical protein
MARKFKGETRMKRPRRKSLSRAKLDVLIEEATVDAYDAAEQAASFHTMFEDHFAVPFRTEVLGVEVTVERIDLADDGCVVAVCARDRTRQRIPILDLPLPTPPPRGSEWIEAYRRWALAR